MTWRRDEAYWQGRPPGYDPDGELPDAIRQRSSTVEIRRAQDYHESVWLRDGAELSDEELWSYERELKKMKLPKKDFSKPPRKNLHSDEPWSNDDTDIGRFVAVMFVKSGDESSAVLVAFHPDAA